MHTYHQATGRWRGPDGEPWATGYSGAPGAKNDGRRETERSVGPIPRGRWKVVGFPYDSANVGPFAIKLQPVGHDAHKRTAFLIHGDSIKAPGTASKGCIILPRAIREKIWTSGDRELEVVT